MSDYSLQTLSQFIRKASASTYAGGGAYEKLPERQGFLELVFTDRDWVYRDSYTGFYRSSGMEVVHYQNKLVWTSNYGGGMVDGQNELAPHTFDFLKQAMLAKPTDWESFRGPKEFNKDSFEYRYTQSGDVSLFHGYEEIYFQKKLVFFHRIHGGLVIGK